MLDLFVYIVYLYLTINRSTFMRLTAAQSEAITNFFDRNPSFKWDTTIGWTDLSACLIITWDDFKCLLVISPTGEVDSRILSK